MPVPAPRKSPGVRHAEAENCEGDQCGEDPMHAEPQSPVVLAEEFEFCLVRFVSDTRGVPLGDPPFPAAPSRTLHYTIPDSYIGPPGRI